jgi:hypothetical protein
MIVLSGGIPENRSLKVILPLKDKDISFGRDLRFQNVTVSGIKLKLIF